MEHHLQEKHTLSMLSDYIKELVYGGIDGIVTTFAVVAGFSGASLGSQSTVVPVISVLLFGIANLFADGLSMGLGNYLALRTEKSVYRKEKAKEEYEVVHSKEAEMAETKFLLMEKGFTDEQAQTLTEIYSQNPTYWVEFMMNYELEMPNPEGTNPMVNGMITFVSFCLFGAVPLLPYLFKTEIYDTFYLSCIATLIALGVLGYLRSRVTGRSMIKSILETVLIGSVAAFVAYFVGTLFRH